MSIAAGDGVGPAPEREAVAAPAPAPSAAKTLHWISAALVLGMFASGVVMTQLGSGSLADTIVSGHKLVGFGVFLLLAARLVYRIQARLRRRWHAQAGGRGVHRALYALALLTPLLGWAGISDFGARETLFGIVLPPIWPEGLGYDAWLFRAHVYAAFGLIALVVLHIGLALQDYVMRGEAGLTKDEAA